MQLALYLNVLLAVTTEPIEPLLIVKPVCARRVFAHARLPRLRHLVHQSFADGVFAIFELERISRGAQLCRQPDRQARRLGAKVTLERNDRKAVAGMQHMLLNGAFESVVVRSYTPARIRRSFEEFRRNWVAPDPQLHGTVVDGKRHTQNFC